MPAKLQMLGGDFTQRPYIRYSAYADGTDFTETRSAGQNYIGVAVATKAPTDKSEYEWGVLGSNVRDTLTLTLKADSWADSKQTIPEAAVTENCTLIVNPTEESNDAYIESAIVLDEAEVGKMVFTCSTVPTEDIAVLVHIIDPLITAESTEILTFDSVEEMNAYEAEDGAIAIVPSEGESGGSGFAVIKLSSLPDTPNIETQLTAEQIAMFNAANGQPVIIETEMETDYGTAVNRIVANYTMGISGVLMEYRASYINSEPTMYTLVFMVGESEGNVTKYYYDLSSLRVQ